MSIQLVLDEPASNLLRRSRRALVGLLGALLLSIGVLATAVPIIYVLALVAALLGEGEAPAPNAALIVTLIVAVAGVTAGLRLVRGERRLALFLRKFGFTEATKALTFAIATALGNSWRLVTLDDVEAPVPAVGPRRRMRWLSIALGVFGAIVLVWGALWIFGGGLQEAVNGAFSAAFGEPTLRELLPRLIGAALVAFIAGLFAVSIVVLPTVALGSLGIFGWVSYGAVRRAEGAKSVTIGSPEAIGPVIASIARRSRRVLGPRLVVTRAAQSVWRDVVRRFASETAAVLVDVSLPTDNLLWEIEAIRSRKDSSWILVGERDHLERLLSAGAPEMTSTGKKLLELIDGEEVLCYSSARTDLRRFSRALRARFEAMGRRERR